MKTKMTDLEKEMVIGEAEQALIRLKEIYNSFDILNAHLGTLVEKLDPEQYEWFHDFWMRFPTYNDLDSLDDFLTNELPQMLKENK